MMRTKKIGVDASDRRLAADQMARWLRLFFDEGQAFELRALQIDHAPPDKLHCRRRFTANQIRQAVEWALKYSGTSRGVYFTLNGIDPRLVADRRPGWATDEDIPSRRWLFIDCDRWKVEDRKRKRSGKSDAEAKRSGNSDAGECAPATCEEMVRTRAVAKEIVTFLRGRGWPYPIVANSGNGFHLFYRVDLPSEDGGLDKKILYALHERFSQPGSVRIDTAVSNPSRITRLYGTLNRKGVATEAAPHRYSRVVETPKPSGPCPGTSSMRSRERPRPNRPDRSQGPSSGRSR
jgi:hypothetical protein